MNTDLQQLVTFQLTGERPGGDPDDIGKLNLHPALLAGYADLSKLRYDYPLVLIDGAGDNGFVRSLSGVVDGVLWCVVGGM